MKQTINKDQFRHAFQNMGRGEQFSYEALGLLFDYLEECENGSDTEFELDVIGLCCDFAEDTPEDIQRYYSIEHDVDDESNLADTVRAYLDDEGHFVGETDTTFIYHKH